jgi:hypothetical protein
MKRELHKAFSYVTPGERLEHAERWRDFKLRLPLFRLGDEASDAAGEAIQSFYGDDILDTLNKTAHYAKRERDYAEALRRELLRRLKLTRKGGKAKRRPTEDWHLICRAQLAKLLKDNPRVKRLSLEQIARDLPPIKTAKKTIAIRTIREFLSKDHEAQLLLGKLAGD